MTLPFLSNCQFELQSRLRADFTFYCEGEQEWLSFAVKRGEVTAPVSPCMWTRGNFQRRLSKHSKQDYRNSSIKPPSLISPSPISQNLKCPLSIKPPTYAKFYNLPNIFHLFSYTILQVEFSMAWDENCLEFIGLSGRNCMLILIRDKRNENLPYLYLPIVF